MYSALYNDWKTQPAILQESRNMALAYFAKRDHLPPGRFVGDQIGRSPDFELIAPVRMNVVCFAPSLPAEASGATIASLLEAARNDGRVFFYPYRLQKPAGGPGSRLQLAHHTRGRPTGFSALTEVYHKWREPNRLQ